MTTQINVTRGPKSLVDQSRQNTSANRNNKLENDNSKKVTKQSADALTNALANQGLVDKNTPIPFDFKRPTFIRQKPAAQRDDRAGVWLVVPSTHYNSEIGGFVPLTINFPATPFTGNFIDLNHKLFAPLSDQGSGLEASANNSYDSGAKPYKLDNFDDFTFEGIVSNTGQEPDLVASRYYSAGSWNYLYDIEITWDDSNFHMGVSTPLVDPMDETCHIYGSGPPIHYFTLFQKTYTFTNRPFGHTFGPNYWWDPSYRPKPPSDYIKHHSDLLHWYDYNKLVPVGLPKDFDFPSWPLCVIKPTELEPGGNDYVGGYIPFPAASGKITREEKRVSGNGIVTAEVANASCLLQVGVNIYSESGYSLGATFQFRKVLNSYGQNYLFYRVIADANSPESSVNYRPHEVQLESVSILNTPKHFAVVKKGTILSLYLDGTLAGEISIPSINQYKNDKSQVSISLNYSGTPDKESLYMPTLDTENGDYLVNSGHVTAAAAMRIGVSGLRFTANQALYKGNSFAAPSSITTLK